MDRLRYLEELRREDPEDSFVLFARPLPVRESAHHLPLKLGEIPDFDSVPYFVLHLPIKPLL